MRVKAGAEKGEYMEALRTSWRKKGSSGSPKQREERRRPWRLQSRGGGSVFAAARREGKMGAQVCDEGILGCCEDMPVRGGQPRCLVATGEERKWGTGTLCPSPGIGGAAEGRLKSWELAINSFSTAAARWPAAKTGGRHGRLPTGFPLFPISVP